MAVTFSPPGIDFGSYALNLSPTRTVTISNATDAEVALTAPSAPFSWPAATPATLAANASLVVTITFTPTAVRTYSSPITAGAGTCPLFGSGLGAADEFESAYDSTESTAPIQGDPGTAGNKYYEVVVPKFALDGNTATPGTSFLRIGNFNATPPSSTGAGLTGEAKSWQLARVVGDAAAIQAAERADLSSDAHPTELSYKGDPNYLLGFADDTRFRQGDTAASWTGRRDATKRLLTKGGWWDHSDGNRISTTAGDKIEVIQGNYKMLVMGRIDSSGTPATLAANTLITDISGGMMAENGPSPTHCIKSIEWTQTDTAWEVHQNNGIGNVYSSFYGETVDIFRGRYKATFTGTAPADYTPENDDSRHVYNVYRTSQDIRQQQGSSNPAQPNPVVMDHSWASKIVDYKRISGNMTSDVHVRGKIDNITKVDGLLQNNTIAHQITTLQTAKAITNTNTAANHFNLTVGLQENINVGLILNLYANAVLSLGVNATSVNGINNTYDGTKLTATLTEQKVTMVQNSLRSLGAVVEGLSTRLHTDVLDLNGGGAVFLGNLSVSLQNMTLL